MLFDQLDDLEAERENPGQCTSAPNPEAELRALWTARGIPKARQDELIADVTARAQPGAKVGPFTIGMHPDQADALRRAFGTRPPKPLKQAQQDELFDPNPQRRIQF
jgi:hypothetical protein